MKQREIKFRAWDGEKMWEIDGNSKVVLEFNKISGWNIVPNKPNYQCKYLAGESSANKEFHLMQFTGLKDKNGVDIYEGDIMERLYKYEVKFDKGRFCLHHKDGYHLFESSYLDFEIIGNIHEHKHLLK